LKDKMESRRPSKTNFPWRRRRWWWWWCNMKSYLKATETQTMSNVLLLKQWRLFR